MRITYSNSRSVNFSDRLKNIFKKKSNGSGSPAAAVSEPRDPHTMVGFLEKGEENVFTTAEDPQASIFVSNSQTRSSRSSTHRAFRAHRPASLPAADGGVYEVPDRTNPFLPTATSARAAQFESHPIVVAPILLRIDGLGPSDDVPTDHYDEHMRLRPLDPSQYVLFHIPHATYTNLTSQPYSFTETTSFTPFTMDGTLFFSRDWSKCGRIWEAMGLHLANGVGWREKTI